MRVALDDAKEEIKGIVTLVSAANSFSDDIGDKFRRLDKLEKEELPDLISKKVEAQGKKFDYSLVVEIMAPARTPEFQNKKKSLLSLAPEYYIQKVKLRMQELGHGDEEVNSLIHYHGIEEELD